MVNFTEIHFRHKLQEVFIESLENPKNKKQDIADKERR
jgi:hypothetical protein